MSRNAVLITGSSKGLGESLALVFSRNNYDIILHGRAEKNLNKVRKKILQNEVDCYIVKGDLKFDKTIEKLVKIAKEKDISILINNAAIHSDNQFENLSLKNLEDILKTNLIAPIKLTKGIYPLFLRKKSGTIININSIDALKAKEYKTTYCTSKYGLRGFTDSLRFEAKKNNIKVIGIYLGGMKTDMYAQTGTDSSKCMDTSEVAQIIFDISKKYQSSGVDDVTINRQLY